MNQSAIARRNSSMWSESAQPCDSPSRSCEPQPLLVGRFPVVRRERVAQSDRILRRQHRVVASLHDQQGRVVARNVLCPLNGIRPARKRARVVGPLVLLFRRAFVSLHGCGQPGGCVDDHDARDRHFPFCESDQRCSSAGREAEQADLVARTQTTQLLQGCDDRGKLLGSADDDRLEHEPAEILRLTANHVFATAWPFACAELRQSQVDLERRDVVERQGFHQCALARWRTEAVPQQDRRPGDLRRKAQQCGHRRQPCFHSHDFSAGSVGCEAEALDVRIVLRGAARSVRQRRSRRQVPPRCIARVRLSSAAVEQAPREQQREQDVA